MILWYYDINDIKSLSFKDGVRDWCIYKHTLIGTDRVYIDQTNNIKQIGGEFSELYS